ncbi:trehalase [Nilaparvata lugens]|uniref:trehalase n=1 Tax=Nilaparvata lugens TaxID=108931 RepID=UPI00193E68ED|nr:trehalase [Nilaparvata lugens]
MDYLKVAIILSTLATVKGCRFCPKTNHRSNPIERDPILEEFPIIINDVPQGCNSEVYCNGDLLHEASLLGFNYLQLKLKKPESFVIARFKIMKAKKHGEAITYTEMEDLIKENFENGNELEPWTPSDFNDHPRFLDEIDDPDYKVWAYELNQFWKILARKVSSDVERNPDHYSLIYVPNGFISPGGTSRELHYWDSYWLVKGLLLSDMHDTARGVIDNLLYLLKRYSFVPNANRMYFLNGRSAPPLLIKMVDDYYEKTRDDEFLREVVTELTFELNHWINYNMGPLTFNDKDYFMACYYVVSEEPRPESYRDDYMIARMFNTAKEKNKFYSNVHSATESGMDFTSRWFIRNKSNAGNTSDIATTEIVPVDLNAILHYNARKISEWYFKLGEDEKGAHYEVLSVIILKGINEVLWDKDEGMWFDYDNENQKRRKYFYASNLTPLWTKSYPTDWSKDELTNNVLFYLERMDLDKFDGIPNSLTETGEKWDFPNAWAPLQSMIVEGLETLGTVAAKIKAYQLANRWIRTTYGGYKTSHVMYDRYDASAFGESRSDDDYSPQKGFGWTNAVVLQFLKEYGKMIGWENDLEMEKRFMHYL